MINRNTLDGMIFLRKTVPAPVVRPETGRRAMYDEETMTKLLDYFLRYREMRLSEKRIKERSEAIIDEVITKG